MISGNFSFFFLIAIRIRRRGGAAEISSGATESMIHSRRILLETVQRSAGTIGTLGMKYLHFGSDIV